MVLIHFPSFHDNVSSAYQTAVFVDFKFRAVDAAVDDEITLASISLERVAGIVIIGCADVTLELIAMAAIRGNESSGVGFIIVIVIIRCLHFTKHHGDEEYCGG